MGAAGGLTGTVGRDGDLGIQSLFSLQDREGNFGVSRITTIA
jgi:hypothetical protein